MFHVIVLSTLNQDHCLFVFLFFVYFLSFFFHKVTMSQVVHITKKEVIMIFESFLLKIGSKHTEKKEISETYFDK